MRKLKLQMQITVDGFVAGPNGDLDWMTWDSKQMDDKPGGYIDPLAYSSDAILMGRKLIEDFVNY